MAKPKEYYVSKLINFLIENGNRFTYAGGYTKAILKCDFHCNCCDEVFSASPNNILSGQGCSACAGRMWTKEKLQKHLDSIGKNLTLLSEYCGANRGIQVACNVCSYEWSSTPGNAKSNGCPACSKKLKGSIKSLQSSIDLLNTKVTVSGEYKNKWTHVDCDCTLCGFSWRASPSTLKRGTSCPSCAPTGFNPGKPAYLYYLRVVDGEDTFWKVGITGKDLKQRFNTEDRKKITVLYLYQFGNGVDAYKSEQNILKMFNVYRVKDKRKILSCGGNTELFHKDVLQMDHLGDVV